jgi:hypothetical protein
LPELRLRDRRDLCDRFFDSRVGLEKYFDYSHSIQRLGLDVLDVVNGRRQRALCNRDNPVSHFLWGKAIEAPDDADYRNINVWKNVCGSAEDGEHAADQDKDRQYHKCIRLAQR